MAGNAKLLSRERVAEHQRVRCGIGHYTSLDVFTAMYRYTDMDGEPMKPFTVEEYEPSTCVVCGLKNWARV